MLCTVKIDGRTLEVPPGTTILEAARLAGVDIPTLCYLPGRAPLTSCFVCVVKLTDPQGRRQIVPACAFPITGNIEVVSGDEEVAALRRRALELLLGHHIGDCVAPCQLACPLRCNIPQILQYAREKRWAEALTLLRHNVGLAGVVAFTCSAPCEKACRRSQWDEGVATRAVFERLLIWESHASPGIKLVDETRTGKRVYIVGATLTGISAGWHLRKLGHDVHILEALPGRGELMARLFTEFLPVTNHQAQKEQLLAALKQDWHAIVASGVVVEWGHELPPNQPPESLLAMADAVLLACGQTARRLAESWGLPLAEELLEVDAKTFQTRLPAIFAAGSAVRGSLAPVRAIAEGQQVARAIDRYLKEISVTEAKSEFIFRAGKLSHEELAVLAARASSGPVLSRMPPPVGRAPSLEEIMAEVGEEASRCFRCACSAAESCKLRQLAARYGADPRRYASLRPPLTEVAQEGEVVYEPGKCIVCGRCVSVTEEWQEIPGITFVGRGFEVRVESPFGKSFSESLGVLADLCVRVCPTGALRRAQDCSAASAASASSSSG